MGATIHPHSLAACGSATAAAPRACASSSIRINPACVAKPASALAKKPKRPGSFHGGDPPSKRARGEVDTRITTRPRPSSDEDRCPAGSLRRGVEALCATKNQSSASPIRLPEVAAVQAKFPACGMRELLGRARLAQARPAAPAVQALCVTKNHSSASPVPLPKVAEAPPKPQDSSMRELLERARLAKARPAAPEAGAVSRREIELRRAEARREMEKVVRTVEFNDPFIDVQDVFK